MTQKSKQLVKTHGQICQGVSEICIHTYTEESGRVIKICMHTQIEKRGSGKRSSHQADLWVKEGQSLVFCGWEIQWEVFGLHWFTLWVVLRRIGAPCGGCSWQQGRRLAIRRLLGLRTYLSRTKTGFCCSSGATCMSNTI